MKDIREKKEYQELAMRREIVRFILNLRVFRHMRYSHTPSVFINENAYERYLDIENNLAWFISCANKGLVNFTALSVYDDDLNMRLKALEETYLATKYESEIPKIRSAINDMTLMIASCPRARILPIELMNFMKEEVTPQNFDIFIKAILKKIPFEKNSEIYKFLMDNTDLSYCFAAYFEGRVPKEEAQIVYEEFLRKVDLELDVNSLFILFRLFIEAGAVINASVLDIILGRDCDLKTFQKFVRALGMFSGNVFDLDLEAYLSSRLNGGERDNLKVEFVRIVEVLLQLFKVANRENKDEIVSMVIRLLKEQGLDELIERFERLLEIEKPQKIVPEPQEIGQDGGDSHEIEELGENGHEEVGGDSGRSMVLQEKQEKKEQQ